jgi:glycosyltransferase involved in cell wall biosynthesis
VSARSSNPAITVAMSVYNGAQFLAPAIESVLAQDFGDFEFLLLDDGSTDKSRAIAEGYAAKDARLRVIARENRGLVASLNELLERASAPLIARFDADDICAPQRLGKQKAFLDCNPDHALVGSDTRYIDEHGSLSAEPVLPRPRDHAAIVANFEAGPNLVHPAVMYRRDSVRALGGYRAAYLHAEDIDLWLRLSEVSKIANLPEVLLDYRISADQISARHVVRQATNAAIAWLAHQRRVDGKGDPTAALTTLPRLDELAAMLGPGAASYVRRRVVDRVLFSAEALGGEGWPILLAHAAESSAEPRLWRAAARLLRAGQPAKAGRVAATLMGLAA